MPLPCPQCDLGGHLLGPRPAAICIWGQPQYAARYRGQCYRMAGPAELEEFLRQPWLFVDLELPEKVWVVILRPGKGHLGRPGRHKNADLKFGLCCAVPSCFQSYQHEPLYGSFLHNRQIPLKKGLLQGVPMDTYMEHAIYEATVRAMLAVEEARLCSCFHGTVWHSIHQKSRKPMG